MSDNEKANVISYAFAIALLMAGAIFVASLVNKDGPKQNIENPSQPAAETPKVGTISGSFTYPSDHIPEAIKACAKNIKSGKETCSDKHLNDDKFFFGTGYELTLEEGEYAVYALLGEQKAPYDSYMSSITSKDFPDYPKCSELKDATVVVSASNPRNGITLGDWYLSLDGECVEQPNQ